jgi:hypothetical protein
VALIHEVVAKLTDPGFVPEPLDHTRPGVQSLLAQKRDRRSREEQHKPLRTYRRDELAEISADIFQDRHGFADARLSVPRTRSPHATCTYSWTRPPSRSRRSGRTVGSERGGVPPAGGR